MIEVSNTRTKPINYNEYTMTKKERLVVLLLACVFVFFLGYVFYHSILLSLLVTPVAFLYPQFKTKQIIQKRKQELLFQFKDMIYSLSSSLSAGLSLEASFGCVISDLKIIYPYEDTFIVNEVLFIENQIQLNERVEDILENFAKRSGLEDIKSFCDVVKSCRNAGGNLVEVIRITTNILNDKIEIKNEIDTLLAEKKYEQKLMSIAPVGMIVILSLAAQDYMTPIFSTLHGRIAMTIAMITIVITYFVSQRMIKINI